MCVRCALIDDSFHFFFWSGCFSWLNGIEYFNEIVSDVEKCTRNGSNKKTIIESVCPHHPNKLDSCKFYSLSVPLLIFTIEIVSNHNPCSRFVVHVLCAFGLKLMKSIEVAKKYRKKTIVRPLLPLSHRWPYLECSANVGCIDLAKMILINYIYLWLNAIIHRSLICWFFDSLVNYSHFICAFFVCATILATMWQTTNNAMPMTARHSAMRIQCV